MSLPRYPEYKDSGVAWLGEVPGHWGIVQFKQFVDIQNGSDHKHIEQVEGYGGTKIQLSLDDVANLQMTVPPLDEQTALTAEAQRGIELLKERRSALISAAVTGKIDVRSVGLKPDLHAVAGKIDVRPQCRSGFSPTGAGL